MPRPRPDIEGLPVATHGGLDHAELAGLGIHPDDVLDFSVSTNPFGPPPGIQEAMCRAPVDRYPDSEATELKRLLSRRLGIPVERLLVGSGSTELIRLVATAYFGPGDVVLIPHPTYGEYETACRIAGAHVLHQPVTEETGFRLDVFATVRLIREHRPKGIFLCNPNNPTGQYLRQEEVERLLSAAGDSLVVLDEAYVAFTASPWSSAGLVGRGNLVALRSMTKDYALAGLRLGYAIATAPIISALRRVRPPWNVSAVAQAAGACALNAAGYLEECRAKIGEAKDFLVKGLAQLGLTPLPSETNFFLVKAGDAAGVRRALLRKGILVRDCASFGLPTYIRLAPRTLPDCRKLLEAMKEIGVQHHAG